MKKKLLSAILTFAMVISFVPSMAFAADTSGLQSLINNATGGQITLESDYTITDTVTIANGITIVGNGHTITYNGTGGALSITATAAVTLENLKIKAESSGAYAIALTSSQPDLTVKDSVITVHTRGINMYHDGGCTGGKLTVDNSTIQNSQVSGYENNTTVGDTRGIALYGVENSNINVINSRIYGFGYCINTSADVGTDGVRHAGNIYNITDSSIWGWSAVNVWTVNNTFNITDSNLRGINRLDGEWNRFATIVVNNGIYNNNSDYANRVNIAGGSVWAYNYGTALHSDFLESSESITQFNFDKDDSDESVYMYYPENSSVFAISNPGTTVENITGYNNVQEEVLSIS